MPAVENENAKRIQHKIRKIFVNARVQTGHQNLIEKCKRLHNKSDEDIFSEKFVSALKYTLVYYDKQGAENILAFVSKYLNLFYMGIPAQSTLSSTNDEIPPFVCKILDLLFSVHKANCSDARLRTLELLCKILSGMPENISISDEVWDMLKKTVLCRLQDKHPPVRAQALYMAKMLQDPKNENCEVIKALIFHFHDPSSLVRRTAVALIALNKVTIPHVLARTRDVNDNVRRNTYLVFSKIKILSLPIKYRVTVLERGLQDRSEVAKRCTEKIVIVNWLETFNKDVVKFLEALDVVNCPEVAIKTVESILKLQSTEEILKKFPRDEQTRLIPKEKLSPEAALLWRCLAYHIWDKGDEEELEAFLPNLTVLCDHIRWFFKLGQPANTPQNEEEQWNEVKEKEVLTHLLQFLRVFDLGDQMGREKLKKLIGDMLMSPRISNNQIKPLIELLVLVVPNTNALIHMLTVTISEIREPSTIIPISAKEIMERDLKASDLRLKLNELRELEYEAVKNKEYAQAQKFNDQIKVTEEELKKSTEDQPSQEVKEDNDPVNLCKCLTIFIEMMNCVRVEAITPTLLSLKEDFLDQCLTSRDLLTQSLAIQARAQFCILDEKLAKEDLIRFLLMISEDGDNEINIPSLKGVFDILQTYGLQCFKHPNQGEDIEEENGDSREKKRTMMTREENFLGDSPLFDEANESFPEHLYLKNLTSLLDCTTNPDLKALAYEGLCKLFLNEVIESPYVLSQIIIKGFSPIFDNEKEDFIRQTFMVFFPRLASDLSRGQEMIEAAFLPTIKTILKAPVGTSDADINLKNVITFLIDHTKPGANQYADQNLHVHNNLAMFICREVYQKLQDPDDYDISVSIYLKSLNQLDVSLDNLAFVQQLRTKIDQIEEKLQEATDIRSLCTFVKKIKDKSLSVMSSVQNTLVTTRSSRSSSLAAVDEGLSSLRQSPPEAKKNTESARNFSDNMDFSVSETESSNCESPDAIPRGIVPESPEMFD